MSRLGSAVAAVVLSLASVGLAEVSIPSVFSDHMVLQRGQKVNVFGKDNPGQKITVRIAQQQKETLAGNDGHWLLKLDAMEAGGPWELQVAGSSQRDYKDVLIGDVWVCSGQSNMQFGMSSVINAAQEIATADNPKIRLMQIPRVRNLQPQEDVSAEWVVCSPKTVASFSAVGYLFGRDLNQQLQVPIGLINSSWGGTAAEAWTPREQLITLPGMQGMLDTPKVSEKEAWAKHGQQMEKWLKSVGLAVEGGEKFKAGWAGMDFDDAAWKTMAEPSLWHDIGIVFNAMGWFRRVVDIPAGMDLKNATLELGAIDDFDVTFINGQEVGKTGGDVPNFWNVPRKYKLADGVLKPGRNVIAVRVLDIGGNGGFGGPAVAMKLTLGGEGKSLPLAGEWKYCVEQEFTIPADKPRPIVPATSNNMATELYNGMIHPLIPFNITGAIWYQGETNAGNPTGYHKLLPLMIQSWRDRWGSEFPFLIVQLAGYMNNGKSAAGDAGWPQFRDVQRQIAQETPKCGLALAIDIGDAADIHPKNKQDVGKRLALQALKVAYGKDVVASGPTCKSIKAEGSNLIVSFGDVGGGLVAKKGTLLHNFAIAGQDGRWAWADAKIQGDTIVLSSAEVAAPVAVRYAWQNTPPAELYNKEGLPAVPFEVKLP